MLYVELSCAAVSCSPCRSKTRGCTCHIREGARAVLRTCRLREGAPAGRSGRGRTCRIREGARAILGRVRTILERCVPFQGGGVPS
eukprot:5199897-Prymnesium_polylepis.1